MKWVKCTFSSSGQTFTKKAYFKNDYSLSECRNNDAFDILIDEYAEEWSILFYLSDDVYVECVFYYNDSNILNELVPLRAVTWQQYHGNDVVIDSQLFTAKLK